MRNQWWWIKYVWPVVVYGGFRSAEIFYMMFRNGYQFKVVHPLGFQGLLDIILYATCLYFLWVDKVRKKYQIHLTISLIWLLGVQLIAQTSSLNILADFSYSFIFLGGLSIGGISVLIFYHFRSSANNSTKQKEKWEKELIQVYVVGKIGFWLLILFYVYIDEYLESTDVLFYLGPFIIDMLEEGYGYLIIIEFILLLSIFSLWLSGIAARRKETIKAQTYDLIAEIGKKAP